MNSPCTIYVIVACARKRWCPPHVFSSRVADVFLGRYSVFLVTLRLSVASNISTTLAKCTGVVSAFVLATTFVVATVCAGVNGVVTLFPPLVQLIALLHSSVLFADLAAPL
jgi:hypothetical protein